MIIFVGLLLLLLLVIGTASGAALLLVLAPSKPRRLVVTSRCTETIPCLMRRKIGLVSVSRPVEVCGVPDSTVADYVQWLAGKSPGGKAILAFKVCPWCAEPFHFQGMVTEVVPDKSESDEDSSS